MSFRLLSKLLECWGMAKRRPKEKRLTFEERLSMLYGDGAWTIRGVERLNLKPIRVSDGPCGLRKIETDEMTLESQVTSVAYPSPALMACSFDTALMEQYGKMLGRECRSHDVQVLLGPGLNIKRNPLCGRNFEYYSEDPYVSGKLAGAFVNGIQSVGVGACVKHFACNSQESYRMVNDSIVDERALHEIYLRGFEISIRDSNPWMLMAAYNKVNGEFACENYYLLIDVLKKKWKYDGVVVSDWGGVNDRILCHENGLDIEMPCYTNRFPRKSHVLSHYKSFSKIVEVSSDRVVLLNERVHDPKYHPAAFSLDEGHAFAVESAEKSIVLAKNNAVLPLKKLRKVAVIGELAKKPCLGGGGSSKVKGYQSKSFLQCAIENEKKGDVEYAPGYSFTQDSDPMIMALDAIELASRADAVIYFMGTNENLEAEGFDRPSMNLPQAQTDLFERLVEVNQNVIVVLATGAPVEAAFVDKASAVFITYFPGEGGGEALYRLVTGRANPSGHLAETWPLRNYEVPSFGFYPGSQIQSLYRESIYVGYRFYLTTNEEVRFPFGHGLSYTNFRYNRLTVSSKSMGLKDKITVSVQITNTTSVPGDTVAQLYIEPTGGNVFKAKRTLQAFKRVHLEGNEKVTVEFKLDRHAFEHYDVNTHAFQVEGGEYVIAIGESCEKIVQSTSINFESDTTFESMVERIPIYYQPPKDGFWQYDDAFEELLGKVIPIRADPRSGPYNLNSTFEDIRSTFIGKKIIAMLEERASKEPGDKEMTMKSMLQLPIRNVVLGGMSERTAQVIVYLANRRFLRALIHKVFGI